MGGFWWSLLGSEPANTSSESLLSLAVTLSFKQPFEKWINCGIYRNLKVNKIFLNKYIPRKTGNNSKNVLFGNWKLNNTWPMKKLHMKQRITKHNDEHF